MRVRKYFFLCLLLIFCSCKKFIQIAPPPTQLISLDVFNNDESATSAVVGIYSNMMGTFGINFASGDLTVYAGLSADELNDKTGVQTQFEQNSIAINNATIKLIWDQGYSYIYDANAVLEGLQNNHSVTDTVRNQLIGEAKFIRAFCDFYLANLFGDIPLITTTDYLTNRHLPRTARATIYAAIVADLQDAENLLTENYVTNDKSRPNKFTASALLARIYLYQKNWTDAQAEASKIIRSSMYLLDDFSNIFLANSSESIWQLIPVATGITWESYTFIPYSGIPNYTITGGLLNDFEPGDLRRSNWVDSVLVDSQTFYFPYKYRASDLSQPTEYYTVFRLSEQFLIRAEAEAVQNNFSGSLNDLNTVRMRAGLFAVSTASVDSLLSMIYHERRVELCFEWGHRWFDLIRTRQADAVLGISKANWKSTDTLFPIPQMEIQNNLALTQNPGY